MPSLNDIASVAEALEKSPVAVVQDRCVAVRNRNASCRRCVQACPAGALDVGGNEVTLSVSLCIACGACSVVCPTGALVSVRPPESELGRACAAQLADGEGRVVIACARLAAKRLAPPEAYAEVPCLPRVGESLLVHVASLGANDVLLADGDCSTCKYRDCSPLTDEAVACANDLLESHGSSARVRRATGFPPDLAEQDVEGKFGTTRRGFFSDAVGAARDTAMTAAKTTLAQELGLDEDIAIGERLRVTEGGTLPQIRSARHDAAINALDALGGPTASQIESRLFGSVSVDSAICNSCGMCAVFCPTGALRRAEADAPGDPLKRLEFSACDCVQCNLCADVCWKGAITVSPTVDAIQLYDFEPVVFDLGRPR